MTMRPHVLVWGEVLWDLFPDGRKLGGACANVAYHLACLGEDVALASRVGDDEMGREARRLLGERGVEVSTVQTDPQRPTGRVEVALSSDGREPIYTLVPDCAWEHIQVTPEVATCLERADAVCFGTLCLRSEIAPFEHAMSLAPKDCLRVCDINLRPRYVDLDVLTVALEYANVVKMNLDEERVLKERMGVDDVPGWLFRDKRADLVILTRGERGSLFMRGDEIVEHPGHAARPGGDNVGAGDSFIAVVVSLLLRDRPLDEIADRANLYAAFVASERGASPAIPQGLIDGVIA